MPGRLPCCGPRLNPLLNPSKFWNQHLAEAVQQHADREWALLGYALGYKEDRDLSGAELEGANLDRANLDGANLTGANLGGVFLGYASGLSAAQLADFERQGAIFDCTG